MSRRSGRWTGPSPARVAKAAAWLARHPGDLRHVPAWYRSLRRGGRALEDGSPWLTFAAREWLQHHVGPTSRVFEWGCGGSTLYFARRVQALISVEHDPIWHEEVKWKLALEERLPSRHELHFVPPDAPAAEGADPSLPPGLSRASYRSDGLPGRTFSGYASFIDRFDEAAFDLILVDGRARNACLAHAIPHLRPGGWLLLDNAERPQYAAGCALLTAHERVDLRGLGPWAPTPWITAAWRIV